MALPAGSRTEVSPRLADRLAIQTVLAIFPAEVVDRALEATGRIEQRRRLLSARTTVYSVLMMSLFPEASYEEVAQRLFDVRSWGEDTYGSVSPPTKAAIYKARVRLGWEPLRELFRGACAEVNSLRTVPVCLADRRVVTWVDATFMLRASPANVSAFPRQRNSPGEPELCVEALALAGNGALISASVGPSANSGIAGVIEDAVASLEHDMLCVSRLRSAEALSSWSSATRSGAQLLWGLNEPLALRVRTPLPDGSYLATVAQHLLAGTRESLVRVIDLTGSSEARTAEAPSRLLTTLLDPHKAPIDALKRVFTLCASEPSPLERLQAVPGERAVLRSKAPDGVVQEAYGYLCLHHVLTRLWTSRSGGQSAAGGSFSL